MLATVPPDQQQQALGQWLYPLVATHPRVKDAGKITGMLLEMGAGPLVEMLGTPSVLAGAIEQACEALEIFETMVPAAAEAGAGDTEKASAPSQADPTPTGKASTPNAVPARTPKAPHPNAKTRLCSMWVQRGYCKNGDKCDFAHGTLDMTNTAQQKAQAKVKVAPLGFRPLQAMRPTAPKKAPSAPPPAES